MLKPKKTTSKKNMREALKEVSKEETIGFYAEIPIRLHWKFKEYLTEQSKIRNRKYSKVEWLTEQIESLP